MSNCKSLNVILCYHCRNNFRCAIKRLSDYYLHHSYSSNINRVINEYRLYYNFIYRRYALELAYPKLSSTFYKIKLLK